MHLSARTFRLPVRCALAGLVASIVACGGDEPAADPFDLSDVPARYLPITQALVADLQELAAPGAAIAIIEQGELTFAYGVGRKDASGAERVRSTTLFRIGSTTKMLTAVAVLQLVQAGAVDLDGRVVEHIPELHLDAAADDERLERVTVRQLLDMTAGISEVDELADHELPDTALGDFFTARWPAIGYFMAPPGAFYNYSNANYQLAGLLAERRAGIPYRQLMRERVFQPLGMHRTTFRGSEVIADGDFAIGDTDRADLPRQIRPDTYDSWGWPSGYAWSSVEDMARLAAFLIEGDPAVLSPALHSVMTSPTHDTRELLDVIRYGFGLQSHTGFASAGSYYGVKLLKHDGKNPGFSAQLFVLPELDFGVVTLVNRGDAAELMRVVERAVELAELPEPTPPPDFSVHPETFAEEVGTYEETHGLGVMTVALVDGQLRIDIPAAAALGITYDPVLQPVSPRNFWLTLNGDPFLATFLHGGPDDPVYLRTRVAVAVRR